MGAVAFVVVTALPLLGGAGLGLGQPWRALALIAAAGGVLVGLSAWPARYRLHRQEVFEHELEALRRLPREELAHLVGAAYRRARYECVETGRGQGRGSTSSSTTGGGRPWCSAATTGRRPSTCPRCAPCTR